MDLIIYDIAQNTFLSFYFAIASPGETNVTLKIINKNIAHKYKLNEKRKIDQKVVSELKNAGVTLKIY